MNDKCDCKQCQQSAIFSKIREQIKDYPDLLEGLEQIQNDYMHQGLDLEVLEAIVAKEWPSHEGYMKNMGWVPDSKVEGDLNA